MRMFISLRYCASNKDVSKPFIQKQTCPLSQLSKRSTWPSGSCVLGSVELTVNSIFISFSALLFELEIKPPRDQWSFRCWASQWLSLWKVHQCIFGLSIKLALSWIQPRLIRPVSCPYWQTHKSRPPDDGGIKCCPGIRLGGLFLATTLNTSLPAIAWSGSTEPEMETRVVILYLPLADKIMQLRRRPVR